jgi:hypothetical protein
MPESNGHSETSYFIYSFFNILAQKLVNAKTGHKASFNQDDLFPSVTLLKKQAAEPIYDYFFLYLRLQDESVCWTTGGNQ